MLTQYLPSYALMRTSVWYEHDNDVWWRITATEVRMRLLWRLREAGAVFTQGMDAQVFRELSALFREPERTRLLTELQIPGAVSLPEQLLRQPQVPGRPALTRYPALPPLTAGHPAGIGG